MATDEFKVSLKDMITTWILSSIKHKKSLEKIDLILLGRQLSEETPLSDGIAWRWSEEEGYEQVTDNRS